MSDIEQGQAVGGSPGAASESLMIIVVAARGLAARDKHGLCDPYCTIQVGDMEQRTAVIPRNCSPHWKTELLFQVDPAIGGGQELIATLHCQKTNSFLGECRVGLDGFIDTPLRYASEHAYPLSRERGAAKRQAMTSAELKKYRKKQKKRKDKKYETISGELVLKIGHVAKKSDERMRRAAATSKPLRFEDYDDVDTEDINEEARYYAKQSKETALRAQRVVEATKEVAASTALKLHAQGDQIRNAQADVSQINLDLKEGNRELRSIRSPFGQIANVFTSGNYKYKHIDRKRMKEEEKERLKKERDRELGRTGTDEKRAEFARKEAQRRERDRMRELIANGDFSHLGEETVDDLEQTEQALDAIHDGLGYLKDVAESMREEVKTHNEMLEVLGDGTDKANLGLRKATAKIRKELK